MSNTREGVVIVAQGRNAQKFLDHLRASPPRLAVISSFDVTSVRLPQASRFEVVASTGHGLPGVEVLPDMAMCRDCVCDISDQSNRRYGYAFTNCTQCGPRYTIIERLPYDRVATTMKSFRMCSDCRKEYEDAGNRRFHAQPIACPKCGPHLQLLDKHGKEVAGDPLVRAASELVRGRIVAVKSLGGFQLACDATQAGAVRRLRRLKRRPHKPFALMCESAHTARSFCHVTREEERLLRSPAAPIVLLRKSSALTKAGRSAVSGLIAPGNDRLGVMLPYTPLHTVLLQEFHRLAGRSVALVMTSANQRGAPIATTDHELLEQLPGVADFVLTHDRPIANRCDDSVVMALGKTTHMVSSARRKAEEVDRVLPVRVARGYAPLVVNLAPMFHVKHPVLAVGGDMRNVFCLASGARAVLSPHIGDMTDSRTESFFLSTLGRLTGWTGIKPARVVCDMHPNYRTTALAQRLSRRWRVPLIRVQHHFAHVLSVLAESGAEAKMLGIALDGTGYGTDGAIWGCEFLLVHNDLSWERVGQLGYLHSASAGDEVPDPMRVAASYLAEARGAGRGKGVQTRLVGPMTSSLGRLFDAVAGITGLCRRATFDGQAPVALCSCLDKGERGWYREGLVRLVDGYVVVEPRVILSRVYEDVRRGVSPGRVAARFQNTVVKVLSEAALSLSRYYGVGTVVVSGGSVQNVGLREGLAATLSAAGVRVLFNRSVPANDGGISLGQAVAASS